MAAASPFLFLHTDDNIVVARETARAGAVWSSGPVSVSSREQIDQGHKMAILPVAAGQWVFKFGQPIGQARIAIQPGDWVHTHNLGFGAAEPDYEFGTAVHEPAPPDQLRTFQGYRRPDGRAATRNYIAIVTTVNCSGTSARYIMQALDRELLAEFPNVDGVVALTHKSGCGFEYAGEDHQRLNRTLAGFARHANVGAALILGLGCETSQASYLVEQHQFVPFNGKGSQRNGGPLVMNIQDHGGVAKTVRRAVDSLRDLLPEANRVQRAPIPVSEIILGTNCGGSDGHSGVTANPALGYASDLLVAQGGTSILAETPEIYGGQHLLTRRAVSREVGEKLLDHIRWWEEYARKFGSSINANPSVGNKKGGLTTIFEKSLGAIAKGGTSPLRAVYGYAEPVTSKGFVVMDTPGLDSPSVTGIVAGGANVVVFTTGRGSCFGCKPTPSIKVATNSSMYHRMVDDMDLNAGRILDGTATVEEVGREIFEKIISVASGEPTKSEAQGIGDEEFAPWQIGPTF